MERRTTGVGGPRRQPQRSNGPPPEPASREDAFSEIFGRRSTHHSHTAAPQPHQHRSQHSQQQPYHQYNYQHAGPNGGFPPPRTTPNPQGNQWRPPHVGGANKPSGPGFEYYGAAASSAGLGLPPIPALPVPQPFTNTSYKPFPNNYSSSIPTSTGPPVLPPLFQQGAPTLPTVQPLQYRNDFAASTSTLSSLGTVGGNLDSIAGAGPNNGTNYSGGARMSGSRASIGSITSPTSSSSNYTDGPSTTPTMASSSDPKMSSSSQSPRSSMGSGPNGTQATGDSSFTSYSSSTASSPPSSKTTLHSTSSQPSSAITLNLSGTISSGPSVLSGSSPASSVATVSANSTGSAALAKRAQSMNHLTITTSKPNNSSTSISSSQSHTTTHANTSLPSIAPAFLSKVAQAFESLIPLSERTKDGLAYKDAFDGREAVDLICEIIKTPDRNLALLLGRALDAQKFFHDVTYDHRLRDSANELYQFKEKMLLPPASFNDDLFIPLGHGTSTPPGEEDGSLSLHSIGGELHGSPSTSSILPTSARFQSSTSLALMDRRDSGGTLPSPTQSLHPSLPTIPPPISQTSSSNSQLPATLHNGAEDDSSDAQLPQGVFTLLLDCYSPTCSADRLCYSIACPRRIEQAKRLNIQPQPGLRRAMSEESLKEVSGDSAPLWIHSVSKAVSDSVSPKEKKRQEAINELIYTERDFVKDLEYLRDCWMIPLRQKDLIEPAERRVEFVQQVFWNLPAIHTNNAVLSDMLTKRQKSHQIVERVGDILLERVPLFQPFVDYGAHQQYGKHEFEKEKGSNPDFQKFTDEVERLPQSRKSELNAFLTKPTTRLGRYPLLLKAILHATPEDHPDARDIPQVLEMLDEWLNKVNSAAGKTQNRIDLANFDRQLRRPRESDHELRLYDEERELIHKGQLKRRGQTSSESADLEVYLLDHMLVLCRWKKDSKSDEPELRLYKKPIPLELLTMVTLDEQYNFNKYGIRPKSLLSRTSTAKSGTLSLAASHRPEKEGKHGFSITFHYLGRRGYSLTLWSISHGGRKKWLEAIDNQQAVVKERSKKIDIVAMESHFSGSSRINCAAPYDAGRRVIYGTDDGVWFSNLTDDRPPVMVLSLPDVTQVDVLEQFQLLIVLADRSVQTFPLDALDPKDPTSALKRGKRISSHTTFFKAGVCSGRMLVCIVKSSPLSTTIKAMDPVEPITQRKKPQSASFSKLMPTRPTETLKVFKEFYIPTESTSIHFLKTRLCVGCTKGFEIVDLETLDTQGLLDPADSNLELVNRRGEKDNIRQVRPMAIYRIEGDFLLCYDEFAFYVNKNGWRVGAPARREDTRWKMTWEGQPTAFALQYPYVLAFDTAFIEVWNVNTGQLSQVILTASPPSPMMPYPSSAPTNSSIRLLFADTPPSTIHSAAIFAQQQQLAVQKSQSRPYPPRPSPGGPQHPQHPAQYGGGPSQPPALGPGGFPPYRPSYPPMHPQQQMLMMQQQPPRPAAPPPNSRNQIIFILDDKVVCAKLAAPAMQT